MLCLVAGLLLCACTHVESTTFKRWEQHRNTIFLNNISENLDAMAGPGFKLKLALEEQFRNSLYIVAVDPADARWELKFQIEKYHPGSRLKRFFTFGLDDGAAAELVVKVALTGEQGMLGAWRVHTRVSGGALGGSELILFEKAAQQILQHLRGY